MNAHVTEHQWVFSLCEQLTLQATGADRKSFVFRHPVLLSAQAHHLLLEAGVDGALVTLLDQARRSFWERPDTFDATLGPLHALFEQLRARTITLDEARQHASQPDIAGLLSSTYIKVVFNPLIEQALDGGAFPVQAADVALASAFAMPFEPLARDLCLAATRGYLLVIHPALTKNPDGSLLTRAQTAVDHVLESASPAIRGALLHELGATYLDAYASQFGPGDAYVSSIGEWLARAVHPMPAPQLALARACDLLAEAAPVRSAGRDRGATLKALLQARVFASVAGGFALDREQCRSIAAQALEHLDRETDADAVAWVERTCARFQIAWP